MRYLRTNTATRITVGPFLDKTDGITPEVALTVTSEKLTLMVDTGGVPTLVLDVAPTASAGANDMVHVTGDDSGFYDLELAAADVNYLGRAMLSLNDVATHCPVFHEFMIVPAVVYDAMFLGTDELDVNVAQWLGTACATPTVAGVPEVDLTHVAGATTNVAALATNVDAILTDTAVIGAAGAGLTAVALSAAGIDAIWDESLVAHQTALTAGRAMTLGGVPIAETTATGTPSTTSIQLTAGSTTDGFYEDQTLVIASGVGAGQARIISTYTGATRTCAFDEPFTTAPAAADAVFIKVDHVHPVSEIQVGLATAAALSTAQTSINDLPTNAELATALDPLPTAAENADAVWDELLSGHAVSGSSGEALSAAGTAGDPWTTALPGAYGAGTAGKIIGDNINATISSRASQTSLDTVDDLLDTEVAAIKTVVDAILVDTAEIGAAGAGLTNINLPNQTMDIVGNITGNLSGSVGSVTGAVGSVTAAVAITSNIKQNQALAGFTFLMTDSTNHNPSTGLTVTVTRSIDGAAFAAGTLSAVTEVGTGVYSVNFGAADLNGKTIILQATAAASDTTFERIVTQV